MRLLLIEDDPELCDGLQQSLAQSGYSVDAARSAHAARTACAATRYEMLILDLGLPDGDGLALLRELRAQNMQAPVLILSARSELDDRIAGLDAGGDDYLAKPFALGELEARVRALLRRGNEPGPQRIALGNLTYDAGTRHVQVGGADLDLTAREMAVLEALLRRPRALVSKEQLFESLYTWDSDANLSAVEVYVSRLRKKLEPAGVAIRMFRGLGYRLEAQGGAAAT
ncbi:MAG: response regulator [Betaproteobacteria bacterium]|nr:response regulator [Betaproteobacteria bacterium]